MASGLSPDTLLAESSSGAEEEQCGRTGQFNPAGCPHASTTPNSTPTASSAGAQAPLCRHTWGFAPGPGGAQLSPGDCHTWTQGLS